MPTDDEAQIRALLDARRAALEAKDADASLQGLAPDLVLFDLPPPLALSGPPARDPGRARQWFDTWDGPIATEMAELVVRTGGDLAFAHALMRLSGARTDGAAGDYWFRSTVCLERVAGAWRIVHEHNSFPMRMDGSGQAATDLTP